MQKHYNPKPSVIVQYYQLNKYNRLTGASYIAELHHLAEHCEFGSTCTKLNSLG